MGDRAEWGDRECEWWRFCVLCKVTWPFCYRWALFRKWLRVRLGGEL